MNHLFNRFVRFLFNKRVLLTKVVQQIFVNSFELVFRAGLKVNKWDFKESIGSAMIDTKVRPWVSIGPVICIVQY